jgi:hemerythrin-like domain-containing protein
MAQMTMNRVIHQAVRRDLERLGQALGRATDGDTTRARDLQRAYANLCTQLVHHHRGEDDWIWPMLSKVGVDQDLLDAMESEHQSMAASLDDTTAAMDAYAASGSALDARAARDSLMRTQAVVARHFAHEEDELEPALHPHTGTPEWKEVEKQFSRQPLSVAGPFFAWLTDGMTEEGRAFLRSTVPAPVTVVMGRVFGRRYHREIAPVWRSR